MDKAEVIARLKAHEAELRAMGVTGLSLFGSVARGEAGAGSDVDVVAALNDDTVRTLFDMAGVNRHISEIVGAKVDLVSEAGVRPPFRQRIERDRVHVF